MIIRSKSAENHRFFSDYRTVGVVSKLDFDENLNELLFGARKHK